LGLSFAGNRGRQAFLLAEKEVLLFCKKAAKNFFNLGLGRFAATASGPDL
jgi:hypothetical protein